jgi:cell wall-associated NlpC family hydrolase
MKIYRLPIILVILITFSVTLIMPSTVAMASSPLDTLSQTLSSSSSNSSFNFFNVLIGMLLGNFLGKNTPTQNPAVSIKSIMPEPADIKSPANSDKGTAIIATAKTFIGSPYVWGGETTAGFDCSSFTQYVMKQNGITLPRTAAEQYEVGTPVDKTNLQIGDLVFFTTYKPGASHVGFYMGNQQFIHDSSAAKQVTISSLDEDFYKQHYIGARRYID